MKKVISLLIALVMILALAACSTSAGTPSASVSEPSGEASQPPDNSNADDNPSEPVNEDVETTYIVLASSLSSAQHENNTKPHAVAENYWIENLYERTNGRYDIKYYGDGQLAANADEYLSGLKDGAIGMTVFVTAMLSGYTNAFAELSVPFLYENNEHVEGILDLGLEQIILDQFSSDVGIQGLALYPDGMRQVTSSKGSVKTASDLKGTKYRVLSDPALMAGFEALGVAVTTIATEELYTSLQQGLVDGQENVYSSMVSLSLHEVQPYLTVTNHYATYTVMTINQRLWDSLSDEDKAIFNEIARESTLAARQARHDLEEEMIVQLADEYGMTFYYPTDEELETLKAPMVEKAWPVAEESMGAERWTYLMELVESYKG